ELVRRARLLRDTDKAASRPAPQFGGYRLCLRDRAGDTLSIDLNVAERADAIWAAYALAIACSEEYDEFDLLYGAYRLASSHMSRAVPKTGEQIKEATQRVVVEREELLQQTHARLARSRKLLAETASLLGRLTPRELSGQAIAADEGSIDVASPVS